MTAALAPPSEITAVTGHGIVQAIVAVTDVVDDFGDVIKPGASSRVDSISPPPRAEAFEELRFYGDDGSWFVRLVVPSRSATSRGGCGTYATSSCDTRVRAATCAWWRPAKPSGPADGHRHRSSPPGQWRAVLAAGGHAWS